MVKFYNKRGTAEQWIKAGKYALNRTRLWRHDFVDNQVRLQLFALAYNLGNFLRRLALPKRVKEWSLRTLRVKLIKIGTKVVKHARYVTFQVVEVNRLDSCFRRNDKWEVLRGWGPFAGMTNKRHCAGGGPARE